MAPPPSCSGGAAIAPAAGGGGDATYTAAIDALPNSVLSVVFDNLGPNDLARSLAVNRAWRALNSGSPAANQVGHCAC